MHTLSTARNNTRKSYNTSMSSAGGTGKTHINDYDIYCAFHGKEKITNFCTDPNCLLPLCPKCIKIHGEEHSRMGIILCYEGVFGQFDTLNECF